MRVITLELFYNVKNSRGGPGVRARVGKNEGGAGQLSLNRSS